MNEGGNATASQEGGNVSRYHMWFQGFQGPKGAF